MDKKRFVFWLIGGTLAVALLLPFLNLYINPYRVLPKDYTRAYEGISINKGYLKISYLLEHPERAETVLLGSSRNAALVETDVGRGAYNAYYDFGVAGVHLRHLMVLLDHGVIPKEVWIGINDFDIWKDPDDFLDDYSKRPYPVGLADRWRFVRLYLFRPLGDTDWQILQKKRPLLPSDRVERRRLDRHVEALLRKERKLYADPRRWRLKLNAQAATLLGYKDDPKQYRIEKTLQEIAALRRLCRRYGIRLVLFFYPTFYKTYIMYNQKRIEAFKRGLAAQGGFFDFYHLDRRALDELAWFDTSHFNYTTGKAIVAAIRDKKGWVDEKNIDAVVRRDRQNIALLLDKRLVEPFIQRFNGAFDLSTLRRVGGVERLSIDPHPGYDFLLNRKGLEVTVKSKIPHFLVTGISPTRANVIVHCEIESPRKTLFQIHFRRNDKESYRQNKPFVVTLYPGINRFNLLVPSQFVKNGLLIAPGVSPGRYRVRRIDFYQ